MKLTTLPQQPSEALLATVKRLSSLLPQIASLFGVEVSPGVSAPRPLRPTRPVRVKPKTAPAKPAATDAVVAAPAVAAPAVSEPVVSEPVVSEPVATEPAAPTSAE